jgi:hypothetical protein
MYAKCPDALVMEALACRDGVLLAQQFGMQQVTVETDCLELVPHWQLACRRTPEVQRACGAEGDPGAELSVSELYS